MYISLNWLREFVEIDKKKSPRVLADLLTLKTAEVEGVTFKNNDVILEFDNKSLTHRPDLWGHEGIAREIGALTGKKFKPYAPKLKLPKKGEKISIKIENSKLCPRFCALVIKNVKVEESPEWLKKRLRTVGHGIHNNIVDVTNYVMADLGQPMHAFDKSKISGNITVRMAQKGETLKTLDGKIRTLDEHMGVVADNKKPLSIAGIIGGGSSEIDENTVDIILEAANWHPAMVRKASIDLGVRTDAVQRFEKSLDPAMAELAIKKAAEIILEICPTAKISGPMTNAGSYKPKYHKMTLDPDKARSKIGVEIKNSEIEKILKSLEFKIEKKEKLYQVTVPGFRATRDVLIEDDLIEEIARIYGYDEIAPSLPTLPTKLPWENRERFQKHRARELFSYGLGFDEVNNYSFYGRTEMKNCLLSEKNHLKLLNYLSQDQTHLRTSLVPNLLKNIRQNVKNFPEFKIYEIGRTYKEAGEFFPIEEKIVTGAVVGYKKNQDVFYEAKGAVEAFFQKFGISPSKPIGEIQDAPYAHPHKAATYLELNGQTLAKIFMINPLVAKNFDLENQNIAFFEINFSEILKTPQTERKYRPIPKFPGIIIDISVLIDKNIGAGKIAECIVNCEKDLIRSAELFDLYEGPNIEKGKKALAFKITLQSCERTLTDADMAKTQAKIFQNLEKIGGIIRGHQASLSQPG